MAEPQPKMSVSSQIGTLRFIASNFAYLKKAIPRESEQNMHYAALMAAIETLVMIAPDWPPRTTPRRTS